MSDGIAALLALLDLEPIEVNIFRGVSSESTRGRVFGGQVAAQALVAAGRTVEHGRVHSLHAYFLRPGDPAAPILYEVDRIRDGRSFTTRRVVAIQHGQAIFNLACSFHEDERGLEHQDAMPDAPRPDELLGDDTPDATGPGTAATYVEQHGLEVRWVSGAPWEPRPAAERERLWFRTREPLPDDQLLHAAVVAFTSDLTLVGTVLRRHGLTSWNRKFFAASLDHCMWFHRPLRADRWLYYEQTSPAAFGARGLSRGEIFTEDGVLVTSVAQEGLLRVGGVEA